MGILGDKGVASVIEDFMAKPIGPVIEICEDREVPSLPTTHGSARSYIGRLSVDERFALLREIVDEGRLIDGDDLDFIANSGSVGTFSDLVSYTCSTFLAAGAEMVPEVLIRSDEQMAAFDAIYDPEPED